MRLSRNCFGQCLSLAAVMVGGLLLTGCLTDAPKGDTASKNPTKEVADVDTLRAGDRVRVELTGVPATIPAHDEDIKDDGTINMDYIGQVKVAGLTTKQAEELMHDKYVPAFYKNLTVTVTAVDRSFFVGGMVNKPGPVYYRGAMTVTKAIQAGGDFTDFADRKRIKLIRSSGKIETVNYFKILDHPELDPVVYAHDKIDVPRRF